MMPPVNYAELRRHGGRAFALIDYGKDYRHNPSEGREVDESHVMALVKMYGESLTGGRSRAFIAAFKEAYRETLFQLTLHPDSVERVKAALHEENRRLSQEQLDALVASGEDYEEVMADLARRVVPTLASNPASDEDDDE